mgnify:CR=1 FL=1
MRGGSLGSHPIGTKLVWDGNQNSQLAQSEDVESSASPAEFRRAQIVRRPHFYNPFPWNYVASRVKELRVRSEFLRMDDEFAMVRHNDMASVTIFGDRRVSGFRIRTAQQTVVDDLSR